MANTHQLLDASDLEGGVSALENAPNFAAIVDTLDDTFDNTLLLSAGDSFIPGPFFNTAADSSFGGTSGALAQAYTRYFTEVVGIDLEAEGIMFEFDSSTGTLADIIGGQFDDGNLDWTGSFFRFLSSNLDFSGGGPLSGLFADEILLAGDIGHDSGALLRLHRAGARQRHHGVRHHRIPQRRSSISLSTSSDPRDDMTGSGAPDAVQGVPGARLICRNGPGTRR